MIDKLEELDRQLFLWLNGLHQPWLDLPMYYMSQGPFWIPVYLWMLWMVYKTYEWKMALWSILGVILVVTFADRGSVELFKEVFQRYRPSRNLEIGPMVHIVNDYRGGKYGFISSHAANFFGIATFVFLLVRKRFTKTAWLVFLWAGFIVYTRIYLGVHYPSDIIVGGLYGILCGLVAYWIFHLIFLKRRWQSG